MNSTSTVAFKITKDILKGNLLVIALINDLYQGKDIKLGTVNGNPALERTGVHKETPQIAGKGTGIAVVKPKKERTKEEEAPKVMGKAKAEEDPISKGTAVNLTMFQNIVPDTKTIKLVREDGNENKVVPRKEEVGIEVLGIPAFIKVVEVQTGVSKDIDIVENVNILAETIERKDGKEPVRVSSNVAEPSKTTGIYAVMATVERDNGNSKLDPIPSTSMMVYIVLARMEEAVSDAPDRAPAKEVVSNKAGTEKIFQGKNAVDMIAVQKDLRTVIENGSVASKLVNSLDAATTKRSIIRGTKRKWISR